MDSVCLHPNRWTEERKGLFREGLWIKLHFPMFQFGSGPLLRPIISFLLHLFDVISASTLLICVALQGNNQALLHPSRFLHLFTVSLRFKKTVIIIAHIQLFWGMKAQTGILINLLHSRYPSSCPCHEGANPSSQDDLSQLPQQ